MIPAGNKAKHLSLVNHTTKAIHHYHHHHGMTTRQQKQSCSGSFKTHSELTIVETKTSCLNFMVHFEISNENEHRLCLQLT